MKRIVLSTLSTAAVATLIATSFSITAEPDLPPATAMPAPSTEATEPTPEEAVAQCEAMLEAKHPDAEGTCSDMAVPPAAGDHVLWPPANSLEEALGLCNELAVDQQQAEDCIAAAYAAWPQSPVTDAPENDFPTEEEVQEDAMAQEQEQIDKDMAELEGPFPGDPGFDCRIHAEQVCYVTIHGQEYAIGFHDGYADLAWEVIN